MAEIKDVTCALCFRTWQPEHCLTFNVSYTVDKSICKPCLVSVFSEVLGRVTMLPSHRTSSQT